MRKAQSRRNAVVLAGFSAGLVLTSILLIFMAPLPLIPDAALTVIAVDGGGSIDQVFQTSSPIQPQRWRSIYVHHSHSADGNAVTLGQDTGGMGDHFLIGNGRGCEDGYIQVGQRWDRQQSAQLPSLRLGADCISICLVGDLDKAPPTSRQLHQLQLLVRSLQTRCGINASGIIAYERPNSPIGIGRMFPTRELSESLVR